jgi:hypothetical protein
MTVLLLIALYGIWVIMGNTSGRPPSQAERSRLHPKNRRSWLS